MKLIAVFCWETLGPHDPPKHCSTPSTRSDGNTTPPIHCGVSMDWICSRKCGGQVDALGSLSQLSGRSCAIRKTLTGWSMLFTSPVRDFKVSADWCIHMRTRDVRFLFHFFWNRPK